ncbi:MULTISPECIES: response regulator [Brevibacillus]|uniref:Two-component system, response regulator YcbB n=1 Tax=Brevibacillus centrosporus TaxID=54910 RepID=A0A1I3QTH5_9BACL|nr:MULTISPECIES: response regulator [Brevibacillus]MDR7315377.1 two-component system response regulator YcbB [Brevibacillus nitrificans]MEC2129500.1 response regulator [Brevibacillus centrosporus]RNB65506.1 response regulator [Brevibacillus centrosporus]SFJ36762.1 two-component system, response regulator YcbB [Brevibacillus centrosporus]GED29851.1 transcriptional regulator [Brevibacillus centrosporus]
MRFFITDDDPAVRSMLAQLIEDADLGEVCGEAEDGSQIDRDFLEWKRVDILLIDLLMPNRDGIETIRDLNEYSGKIVMISQIESKNMIAEAYSLGIEYYITKPVNRFEVISVLRKVREKILLQRSIEGIQRSLNVLSGQSGHSQRGQTDTERNLVASARFLLTELGMISESGTKDLLDMVEYLNKWEKEKAGEESFPSLKGIFLQVAANKLGTEDSSLVQKEMKAAEQRVRRAIYQALTHLASLGLTDYAHPKFESYATMFFDFTEVRKRMRELESQKRTGLSATKINTKKFMVVLYLESKRRIG